MQQVEGPSLQETKTSAAKTGKPRWRRYVGDCLLSIAGVAMVTGMIAAAHLYPQVPTISFAYLLIVLALAGTRGLFAAILTSVLAFLSFDFFFFTPPYTFIVVNLEDLLTLCIFLVAAIVASELAAELRRRAQEARNREREMRMLYEKARELAALQERQRLARELHDSVSQALYGISLGAHTAREALESDPGQARTSIEYVITLAEAGLAEMRALIFELRPDSMENEGLVAALTKQVAVLRMRYKLMVEADLGEEPDLPIETKHALYRIVQEALHNVVKHARANHVLLRLTRQADEILLEVCDDGGGFDTSREFPGHLGLLSMRERAASVGGMLVIESEPERGTCIHVQIPQSNP